MTARASNPSLEYKSKYIKVKHPKWGLVDQHRAVMQDHLGRRLSRNQVVHHINDDKHDNRLENLEVMSLSSHSRMHMIAKPNIRVFSAEDREFLSKLWSGENSTSSKITNSQALDIRKRSVLQSARSLAREFNVHHSTIGRILSRKTFKKI